MKRIVLAASIAVASCAAPSSPDPAAGEGVVIYPAKAVVTMAGEDVVAEAVAVSGDRVVSTGTLARLTAAMPAEIGRAHV